MEALRLYRMTKIFPLCVTYGALKKIYYSYINQQMHTYEAVKLYILCLILYTYMFRLLLWPSSGCLIIDIQGVQQKLHKMHDKIIQDFCPFILL
jgi:hypothetical protein